MPTPFNHLVHADHMLNSGILPEALRRSLLRARPAFLLGNTAPDLASVTSHSRQDTHFFQVPLRRHGPAHLRLLKAHPQLERPSELRPEHAAFIAGYLTHLWLDQSWIVNIFMPYFGLGLGAAGFSNRLLEHNLLRAYADQKDFELLGPDTHDALSQTSPNGWLPFASDTDILRWRSHVTDQLAPGAASRTVEVFAHRHGLRPEQFAAELDSEPRMSAILGRRLPPDLLDRYWQAAGTATAELVRYYLEDRVRAAPLASAPITRSLAGDPAEPGDTYESHRAV